ncbi:Serine/threonine-protein phosphatase [Fasciolopsis buskii]|uniref:Serine/threonine-protein phosphatase n=1 Tax=Fasciolopsis buskii TaxID=27845 RepID=A0A8E0S8S1_9TREM|nr:Serine/threonine-protein phosphatase [Fasciolopsis buski]
MQQSYFVHKKRAAVLRNTDSMMRRLLEVEVTRGRAAELSEKELTDLTVQVTELFLQDNACLDVDLHEPLYILGDIFGQYGDLLHIFEELGFPPQTRYLLLGNYVDRGHNSIEVLAFLFIYKMKFPNHIYMLRGNHECEFVSCQYGFLGECNKRYSKHLWRVFMNAFDCLPAVAIVENCILCVHSGLIPCLEKFSLTSLAKLRLFIMDLIRRPVSLTNNFLLTQLTWSEPSIDSRGWSRNPVGLGLNFGENVVDTFCQIFDLQMVIRGHDLLEKGYEFSANDRLLTIFTAPNMSGQFHNLGALVHLYRTSESPVEICGQIKVIKPSSKLTRGLCFYQPLVIEDSLSSRYVDQNAHFKQTHDFSKLSKTERRKNGTNILSVTK